MFSEIPDNQINTLWERGGFPLSFLSRNDYESFQWRKSYISTFLERDIPSLGINIPQVTLRRFWQMITHYQGQVINYSELGRSFAIADTTVSRYIDILSETFMIRQLQPWYENIKKRQVRRPKLYFRDSGIFHALLNVENKRALLSHPKLGASWEGFALEQVTNHFEINHEDTYFWAVHQQGELDLFFQKNGKRYGVEFKFSDSPEYSKSMDMAYKELSLDYLFCIYPGDKKFPLRNHAEACGLRMIKKI